jgi:CheY-like chemotaxis protein
LRGSETILLVEDAEAIRKLAAEFLSSHGFEVLSAGNAEEAVTIAAAHAGRIHLLVTDVIMPGQNGRVLAERLVARYPRIKVLYISGYTDSFIAGHGVLESDSNCLISRSRKKRLYTAYTQSTRRFGQQLTRAAYQRDGAGWRAETAGNLKDLRCREF